MAKYSVVVTDSRHASYEIERNILAKIDAELTLCNCVTEEDLLHECRDADGILLDMAPMSAKVVAGLNRCQVINRYGVGYDNVAVKACTNRGITVTNVPDYCAEDVSDHALALLFSCLRQTAQRDRLVRCGEWNIQNWRSTRIAGKTLGVLGAGRIARALIRKVSGFGLKEILVYDPYIDRDTIEALHAKKVSFEEVLSASDFISLHMPVTDETKGIIGERALALMKPSAILINTGRGPLVDDTALVSALSRCQIAFAGLDTHCVEPLPKDSPYLKLDNVVLTDHTAYNTVEGTMELKVKSAENIVAVLLGQKPAYPVN